jgi:M6 family metalloprotease-like protein
LLIEASRQVNPFSFLAPLLFCVFSENPMSYSIFQNSFTFYPHRFLPHRLKDFADLLRTAVITLILMLTLVANLSGAVFRGEMFTYHQPDGSELPIKLWGDDDYADEETIDGWRIVRDPKTQFWCYATLSADGMQLISTEIVAGVGSPEALGINKHLRIAKDERMRQHRIHQRSRGRDARGRVQREVNAAALEGVIAPAPPSSTTVGARRGLTMLFRFPDHLDDATITRTQVDAYCNQETGFTEFGNNGSVRQYFSDVSGGLLTYTNHVTDYFTTPNNRDYYTDESISQGTRAREILRQGLDALEAANFDFRSLDLNKDGEIDGINCFYAGERDNAWAKGLWPHASSINWTSKKTGLKAGAYQITDMSSKLELGTFCHENGHMLCDYPDLYDYDDSSDGGAGAFCLMNSGGHGTNPNPPCGYLRYKSGWGTATVINPSTNIQASLTAQSGNKVLGQFLIYKKDATEYYLIENRFKGGRDANLPTGGIAIWHVDEKGNHNDERFAHQSNHENYECALVQADNLRDLEFSEGSDANDLFYLGNTAALYTGTFSDSSDASAMDNNAHWWDGTKSGLRLSAFSARGNTMTLQVVTELVKPVLTWATPAAISYGTLLTNTQLNASANVPGTFTYTPAVGALLNSGSKTLSVLFRPTDSARYATASATVSVNVTQATLRVTANSASRAFGVANPTFTGTVTGLLASDSITTTYASSATAITNVGTYGPSTSQAITPTLSDPDSRLGNYAVTLVKGTLTISRATLTITATNATMVQGQSIPILSASSIGLIAPDTLETLDTPPVLTTTATSASPVGTYPITLSAAADRNYTIQLINGTLTVAQDSGGSASGGGGGGGKKCGLGAGLATLLFSLMASMRLMLVWRSNRLRK